jgi:hypothetical protein
VGLDEAAEVAFGLVGEHFEEVGEVLGLGGELDDLGDLAQGDEDLAAEAGVGDLEAAHGRAAALLVEEGGGAVGGLQGGELGLGLVELGVE